MNQTRACLIVALVVAAVHAVKLPSGWQSCKQNDKEERDACLKPVVEKAILSLMNGNPSLGVLPLDPLRFTSLGIEGSGPVSINLTFFDLDINNLKTLEVTKIDSNWDSFMINLFLKIKEPLTFTGKYDINGKVLILPIVGKGNCKLVFDTFDAKLGFSGHENVRGKDTHLHIKQGTVEFNTTKFSINFENLFNGDKALGDNMNKFLNENSLLILEELKKPISGAFGQGFRAIANRVFDKIPMSEFAPNGS